MNDGRTQNTVSFIFVPRIRESIRADHQTDPNDARQFSNVHALRNVINSTVVQKSAKFTTGNRGGGLCLSCVILMSLAGPKHFREQEVIRITQVKHQVSLIYLNYFLRVHLEQFSKHSRKPGI